MGTSLSRPFNSSRGKEIRRHSHTYPGTEDRFPLWQRWRDAIKLYNDSTFTGLEKLEGKISRLREVERKARSMYHRGPKADGEELLQYAKSNSDKCPGMWKQLNELYELEKEKYSMLRKLIPDKGLPDSEDDAAPPTPLYGWWCVVVGIGSYSAPGGPLAGPRPDAEAVYEFLTHHLAIPPSNIRLLVDSQATRENILSTFNEHLLNNPKIRKGDKRLIYFAGHGTSHKASKYFSKGPAQAGYIEAICPIDRGKRDESGQIIHDISDREMNQFLKAVSTKWGPENLLIFDCCHSGSTTRGGSETRAGRSVRSSFTARNAPPLPDAVRGMLKAAQRNRRWDNQSALEPNWEPDITTHVMLAACKRDELAVEFNGRGIFTEALLKVLGKLRPGECSWEGLMAQIQVGPFALQTPQALGCSESKLWFVQQ